MNQLTVVSKLNQAIEDLEQTGREIYYAISFLELDNPARANLIQALRLLGIHKPADVGLSDSVLNKNRK